MKTYNKTKNLIIRLDGNSVNEGISVFELAPALLSIGNIIKESNTEIFPLGKDIGIHVKPFENGSFIVEIGLFAQNNLQQMLDLTSVTNVQQIKELLEWLGIIQVSTHTAGIGLIQLIKWLKGQPKKVERLQSGDIRYTNINDDSITVNVNVDKLYQNETIHEHFYLGYGKILEEDGIDRIETYLKDEPENKQTSTKTDLDSFRAYSDNPIEIDIDEISESTYETHLNFKRGSYEGQKDNWSFRRGDQLITATIKDEEFLSKIRAGKIRPFARDLLKVELLEKRRIRGTELLTPTYEIIEVLDYKESKVSPSLFRDKD